MILLNVLVLMVLFFIVEATYMYKYEENALDKINSIRWEYSRQPLIITSVIQKSAQELANNLSLLDLGLNASVYNKSHIECRQPKCNHILAMESHLDNRPLEFCNLEKIIELWGNNTISHTDEHSKYEIYYQNNNANPFDQLI